MTSLSSDDSTLLERAEALAARGQFGEALERYREVKTRHPSSVEATFGMATVSLLMQRHAAGYALFQEVDELVQAQGGGKTERALVQARLGLSAYHLGRARLARTHWELSLELEPSEEVRGWLSEIHGMLDPLVSIVVSTYNYGRYLTDAIESLCAQTYKNLQLIVVDDCSTDNTADVVAALSERFHFQYLKTPANGGPSVALNLGMQHVEGEYTITFDADDVMLPEAVALHVDNMRANPHAIFSYGEMDLWHEDGSYTKEHVPAIDGEMFHFILAGNFILHGTVMFRTEAWRRTRGFNPKTTFQDSDMWLQLLRLGPGVGLKQLVAHYRRHGAAASATPRLKTQYRSRMKVLRRWKDEPNFDMAWMNRWGYHDKVLTDEHVRELLEEGDEDAYLFHRRSRALGQAGDVAQAMVFARRAAGCVGPDSYLAPAIYANLLETLDRHGAAGEAMKLCRDMLAKRQQFKTADFCFAAAEFLLARCKTQPKDVHKLIADAQQYYEQCVRIGEPRALYITKPGAGGAAAYHQLGQLHVLLKKYDKAVDYFMRACEHGHLKSYEALTETRRKMGLMKTIPEANDR